MKVTTPKQHWPIRVYYENTDAGGVVYHADYLAFYERARTEMLRKLGFSQQVLLQQQRAFVVRRMNIEYIAPAYLDDELLVVSYVSEKTAASLTFKQQIYRQEPYQLINEAQSLIVFIDKQKMKPIVLPTNLVMELV